MIILSISLIFLILSNSFLYLHLRKRDNLTHKNQTEGLILEEKIATLKLDLEEKNQKLNSLEKDNNELRNLKGLFEGSFSQAKHEINNLNEECLKYEAQIKELTNKIIEFEKTKERFSQNLQSLEREKTEWNKNKETILLQLSEELIKKNHEQQSKMAAANQEQVAMVTNNLLKNFENVFSKMQNLDDEVKKVADVRTALLNPGGAGKSSEVTLENVLKSSNLKEKADLNSAGDYILQSHFSNATSEDAKRPDAILFLPNNHIIIIDSKSSSHFLELETARKNKDEISEKTIQGKIKESMRKHVSDLKKRNYADFLEKEMHLKNIFDYKILNVMFLQTEKMLETVEEIEYGFCDKSMNDGIFILSPIGLINLLNQAKFIVERIKQQENIVDLKKEIEKLIDNLALTMKESQELGKVINRSLNLHNKIAARFNRGIYSNIKNLGELGISSKKSDEIKLLENYEVEEKDE